MSKQHQHNADTCRCDEVLQRNISAEHRDRGIHHKRVHDMKMTQHRLLPIGFKMYEALIKKQLKLGHVDVKLVFYWMNITMSPIKLTSIV